MVFTIALLFLTLTYSNTFACWFVTTLAENNLGGTLPDEIRVLTSLQDLDFYTNMIGGPLPTILQELTDLATLDVEMNMLTGPAFVALPESVEKYRVSLNDLTGTIPDLSALGGLIELWAAGNELSGSLPTSIGGNTKLSSLIIYDNGLAGTLPSELGNLVLEQLTAHRNSFVGTIPEELYQNTDFREIRYVATEYIVHINHFDRIADMTDGSPHACFPFSHFYNCSCLTGWIKIC